jgi:hypothetical protein
MAPDGAIWRVETLPGIGHLFQGAIGTFSETPGGQPAGERIAGRSDYAHQPADPGQVVQERIS